MGAGDSAGQEIGFRRGCGRNDFFSHMGLQWLRLPIELVSEIIDEFTTAEEARFYPFLEVSAGDPGTAPDPSRAGEYGPDAGRPRIQSLESSLGLTRAVFEPRLFE